MLRIQLIGLLVMLTGVVFAQSNLHWAKHFGGAGKDNIDFVQIGMDKSIYTSGKFSSTVDFNPGIGTNILHSSGDYDVFITKFDSNGNFIWAYKIGGTSPELVASMKLDESENIYITGTFMDTVDFDPGAGVYTLHSVVTSSFILKLNKDGHFIWVKQIDNLLYGLQIFNAVGNNLYFNGRFNFTIDVDPGINTFNLITNGNGDIFLLKLDSSGHFIWAKQIGGNGYDVANDAIIDSASNIYLCGYFSDTSDFDPNIGIYNLYPQYGRAYILKLDSNGNFIWAKNYGRPLAGGQAYGRSIAMDKNHNLYLSGYFQGTLDFNPGPGVDTIISNGQLDIFICKLDSVGNLKWVKSMGSKRDDGSFRPIIDSKGNVYIPGVFQDTMDVDPGIGIHNLYCNITFFAYAVGFISKLDSSGNFIWAQQFGFDNNSAIGLILDKDENLYGYGYFSETVDFDGTDAVYNLTSTGVDDAIIFKMTSWPTNIPPLPTTDGVSLYPNPSDQSSILQFTSQQQYPYQISIYSITGSLVKNSTGVAIIGENKITLDIENLPPSMYFVSIILDNQKVNTLKLIKY